MHKRDVCIYKRDVCTYKRDMFIKQKSQGQVSEDLQRQVV